MRKYIEEDVEEEEVEDVVRDDQQMLHMVEEEVALRVCILKS